MEAPVYDVPEAIRIGERESQGSGVTVADIDEDEACHEFPSVGLVQRNRFTAARDRYRVGLSGFLSTVP